MKFLLAVLTSLLLLTGCTGLDLNHKQMGSFHNIESSSTGGLTPSLKTMVTMMCMEMPSESYYERFYVDNAHQEEIICNGHFVFLDKNAGQQAGWGSGALNGAVSTAGTVATGYFVYQGMKHMGTDVNNNTTNNANGGGGGSGGEGFGMSSSNSQGGTAYGLGGTSNSSSFGNHSTNNADGRSYSNNSGTNTNTNTNQNSNNNMN